MDFPTDWDINKYYDKTEVQEHWNLRKAFMKTHKHMYPEGRLVALAKVFYNMEFMGCQYDPELMKLVQNMSNQVDIIVQHWERKKTKLKRTFVRASDAVKRKTIEPDEESQQKTMSFVSETSESNWRRNCVGSDNQMSRTQIKKMERIAQKEFKKQIYKVAFNIKNHLDIGLLNRVQNQPGVKAKLVLFEKEDGSLLPFSILERSAQKANLLFKILAIEPGKYEMKINDETIAEYTMPDLTVPVSKKKAYPDSVRKNISQIAYDYVKQYCFTVVEINPRDTEAISTDISQKNEKQKDDSFKLSMDSIGAKMMKQMGWGGQGLGKNETGIVKPIEAEIRVNRRGFGNPQDNVSFKKSIKDYLQNYLSTGETKRLFFSSDFTKEDRAYIHQLTISIGMLNSKSYGKNENRYLTVERKLTVWEIVEQLLANGGSTDRYSLKKPIMFL